MITRDSIWHLQLPATHLSSVEPRGLLLLLGRCKQGEKPTETGLIPFIVYPSLDDQQQSAPQAAHLPAFSVWAISRLS